MLISFAYIFIVGLVLSKILSYLKIPDVVAMIFGGILLSKINALDEIIITISPELRQIALVIILIRAGLGVDLKKLKEVGKPAVLMSFLPAIFEITAVTVLASAIFDMDIRYSAILGCVVAAVSPAIIVPRMLKLQTTGYGKDKNIAELIMTSASIDDIFVIILFYSLINLETSNLALIPVNIVLGIIIGAIIGTLLTFLKKNANSLVLICLSISFILLELEKIIPFSALLSIMTMGLFFRRKNQQEYKQLADKFSSLWQGASIILFVIVGYSMNLEDIANIRAIILIMVCLIFRSAGVLLALKGTKLNQKERVFCMISYLPKATVQAAIGSIPLSMGIEHGQLILTISIISIIITAPIGAFLIDNSYTKLLTKN